MMKEICEALKINWWQDCPPATIFIFNFLIMNKGKKILMKKQKCMGVKTKIVKLCMWGFHHNEVSWPQD